MTTFLLIALLTLGQPGGAETLYDRLGAARGVDSIVDGLVERSVADPRIAHTFDGADLDRLREMLALQICDVTGGPCTYDGLSMSDAHIGLDLTTAHFNALVEALQDAMDEEGVPFGAQAELLALLAPMHGDMVKPR